MPPTESAEPLGPDLDISGSGRSAASSPVEPFLQGRTAVRDDDESPRSRRFAYDLAMAWLDADSQLGSLSACPEMRRRARLTGTVNPL
jgi:hypothetical protein